MKKVLAFLVFLSYMNISMLDNIADDEDDDIGQVCYISGAVEYCITQPVSILRKKKPGEQKNRRFTEYRSCKIKAVSFDIITPPPEARRIA